MMFSDPAAGIPLEFAKRGTNWAVVIKYYLFIVGGIFLFSSVGFLVIKIWRFLKERKEREKLEEKKKAEETREYRMPPGGWPTPAGD